MRKHHAHIIAAVNAQFTPWYESAKKDWVTTVDLDFDTLRGKYHIPAGTKTDLFSCVPNTGYTRFHKAALLHDRLRADAAVSREIADVCFHQEMIAAIADIHRALLLTDCELKVIERETFRLSRVAALYMLGVSGKIGTLYLWADKLF